MTAALSLPWWMPAYFRACVLFAALHGLAPDSEKIASTIARHVKVKIV